MMPYSHKPMPMGGCGPRHWGPPIRECQKKCRELLVEPATKDAAQAAAPTAPAAGTSGGLVLERSEGIRTNIDTLPVNAGETGSGKAIIGGGCCVELSVEYMPSTPVVTVNSPTDQKCAVTVEVIDSEGCSLVWHKVFQEGYHVKESIITTYPGARLGVKVTNAVARVRWCEIFSC